MTQSLESLAVEVKKPDLPPITHGDDRAKKERERSVCLREYKPKKGKRNSRVLDA